MWINSFFKKQNRSKIKDSFEKKLLLSKNERNLNDSDDGKEFVHNLFNHFLEL